MIFSQASLLAFLKVMSEINPVPFSPPVELNVFVIKVLLTRSVLLKFEVSCYQCHVTCTGLIMLFSALRSWLRWALMRKFCVFYSISQLKKLCATNRCSKMVSWEGESIEHSPQGPPLQPTCAQAQLLPSSIHSSMPLHKTSSPKQPNEILIQLGTVHVSKRPFTHRLVLFSLPRHDIRPSLIAPLYAPALK